MKWLARIGLLLLFSLAALLAAGAWLLGTESGLRWALARAQAASAEKLAVEGASGVLAGAVRVQRLAYESEGFSLEARDLHLRASLLAALGGRIALDPLQAGSLEIVLRDDGGKAPAPPRLPYGIALADVSLERLDIVARGERIGLRDVRLSHLNIDRSLSAEGSLRYPHQRFPVEASFTVDGSLERMTVGAALTLAGVPAKGKALVRPFGEPRLEALEASGGPVDLARFDAALPRTAVSASIDARATAGGGLTGSLMASNAAHGPLDEEKVPVARLQTRFATEDLRSATLEQLMIVVSGGGSLEGKGEIGAGSARAELRAAGIDLRAIRSTLRASRLDGRLQVSLQKDVQVLSGRLTQDDLSVEAELTRQGNTLDVRRLRAAAQGGEVSGAGKLRLDDLHVDAALELVRFNPAAFGDYPEGSLSASLVAAGTAEQADVTWTMRESTLLGRPLQSAGSARIVAKSRLARAQVEATYAGARASVRGSFGRPGDEMAWQLEVPRLGDFSAGLAGTLRASGVASGTWSDPEAAGSVRVDKLRVAGFQAREARATFKGRLSQHELQLFAAAPEIALEARLRGGWLGAPGWSGELLSLANAGTYPLKLARPTRLRASRDMVELGRLEATLGEGSLVIASAAWRPERLSSEGEFAGLPAQWLVALTGLAQRISGNLLLDGAWSLAAAPRLEGTVRLRRGNGDISVDNTALELREAALEGRFTGGRLAATGRLASRYGHADIEGELAPAPGEAGLGYGAASPVSWRARAELAQLRALTLGLFDEVRLDGRISAELAGAGTVGEPTLGGKLAGEAISVEAPAHGVFLRNGRLRAALEGNALRVAELSIQGGEGRFTASGLLPLRFAEGAATLEWRAQNFTVIERADMRLAASGEGTARFDGKRVSLEGEVRADRGHVTVQRERLPQLGEDVVVVGEPRAQRGGPLRLPVALDLFVDLGENLTVQAQGFDGKLAGRVQVQTTAEGELRVYGEVRAVNATFLAYGQRLEVDPGVLLFDGPLDNPSLRIIAWRRNQQVEAGVQISGTARVPRVQLVSQPPVPEGERLSWLVLGRAPGDASQADLGLLQAAAGALLASGDAMPLDRRLARSVGLDEVSLRGTGEVQDRVVAFGKRLSERAYVSYERGLGALASNLVKLDYALSQRWSLRAETGSTAAGSTTSGWGLFYRFSWD